MSDFAGFIALFILVVYILVPAACSRAGLRVRINESAYVIKLEPVDEVPK